jgi:hypothetical protein
VRFLIADSVNPGTMRLTTAAWVLLLALSPLAYIGSAYLEMRISKAARPISINRASAIHLATEFAEARQNAIKGWTPLVTGTRQDAARVLKRTPLPEQERFAAPIAAQVTFQEPKGSRSFQVDLAPDGRVLAFDDHVSPNSSIGVEESAERAVAERDLHEWLGAAPPFPLEFAQVRAGDRGRKRTFVWKAPLPQAAEATMEFQVDVAGGLVVGRRYVVQSNHTDRWRIPRLIIGILTGLMLSATGIYAIVRFFRRKADREISLRRTLAVMSAFLAFMMFFIASGSVEGNVRAASANGATLPPAFFWSIFLLMFSVVGIFFGVAYGAGEGDLRAAYPGKLTSLDALLSGKLFSRNVARSILAGGGIAGWLLLVKNASLLLAGSGPANDGLEVLNSLLLSYPLLGLVADKTVDAITISTFALLLPISILRPRIRRNRLFYALLPLFCALGGGIWLMESASPASRVISIATGVAAVCLPFFFEDFLATISCVLALQFVAELARRSAVSMEWRQYAVNVIAAGVLFLLVQLYFAYRGRTWLDTEVRPAYAKYLAEHLSMQAEIGAARQAQLRLLPDHPPKIPGLSIAGSCVPAREVGGDFYDFYQLDDHRLGVFLAEGGNRELGPAMTIALAKGFLLYTSRLELPPAEVLRRLQETLASVQQNAGSTISMLYAMVDARTGAIRFARSGNTAQLLINGRDTAVEVSTERSAGRTPILHGAGRLDPGDALLFYTDGLAAQIEKETSRTPGQFFAKIMHEIRGGSATELHAALMGAANKKRHDNPPDDLTAVVIRMETRSEYAIEVVA